MSRSKISELQTSDACISWTFSGTMYQYPCSPGSTALVFPSEQRILLVDKLDETAPNNAIILSATASRISRIANPEPSSICIAYCLYIRNAPAIIIACKDRELWGHINENGDLNGLQEWR